VLINETCTLGIVARPSFVPLMVTAPLSIAFGAGDDAGEERIYGWCVGANCAWHKYRGSSLGVELQKILQPLRNQANLPEQGTSMQCTVAIVRKRENDASEYKSCVSRHWQFSRP
jgi:hypothetical protein